MFFVKKLRFLPCGLFRKAEAEKIGFFNIPGRKDYFLEQKSENSKIS